MKKLLNLFPVISRLQPEVTAIRFDSNPQIVPEMDPGIGTNLNGPSVLQVPMWSPSHAGLYRMYFAHHRGTFIRVAHAPGPEGPWEIDNTRVLGLNDTPCRSHIASPDLHVIDARREIRMYFHGDTAQGQKTFVAVSKDGLNFTTRPQALSPFYLRAFPHRDAWFGIARHPSRVSGGILVRSKDGLSPFELGPPMIDKMRHGALLKTGNDLWMFFSRIGDEPERILATRIPLRRNWRRWKHGKISEVLRPETDPEGFGRPLMPSEPGMANGPLHELRDPAVLRSGGEHFLFYSGAGESNICGARLRFDPSKP